MIKVLKFLFCLGITVIAVVSCRTFFEGEKIRFGSETCNKKIDVPRRTLDSINFRPFGY